MNWIICAVNDDTTRMTQPDLEAAKDALAAYIATTGCDLCKASALQVMTAVEELIGLQDRGEEFVRYLDDDCTVLKSMMENNNGKRETSNSEDE